MNHEQLVEKMLKDFDESQQQDLPDETIIRNSVQTPDGTELVSQTRHDCVWYDDENGETYMVDGGRAYLRRSVNEEPPLETTICYFDGHEVVRDAFTWGTYGKDGDEELQRVKLSDMEDSHIQAIINDGYNVWPLMKSELQWRESAAARKMVRKRDIERLQRIMQKYPDRTEGLVLKLEPIIERFNNNEFN